MDDFFLFVGVTVGASILGFCIGQAILVLWGIK